VWEVQWESVFGTTFPAYYAFFAKRHMYEFGTTRDQLMEVAIKKHYYGARNPMALFQKEITIGKAKKSEKVSTPLHVYDCCANADGATCIIIAEEARASEIFKKPAWLDGKVAVNVDGGLKAKGHPIGATGMSMTYEIPKQPWGEAGERQVLDADVGLTHNMGRIGQYCFVHVLRRD